MAFASKSMPDAVHSNPELQAALERIYTLHRKEMDFRLESGPYRDLLIKLGNPQNRLPPVIHVAGTNGKGSTIAMMRGLAESRGLKVHAYTSPHLFRYNERIRVAGKLISNDDLLSGINYINTVNSDAAITFFEFTNALMFHLFSTIPADLVLLETGMGGRLDCTNVVDKPACTMITSLSYDHTHLLGDTMEKIAFEKAGILKPGVPCVVAPQRYPEVLPVIEQRAKELDCILLHAKPDDSIPELPLKGAHQRDNAATAMLAIQQLYPDMTWPKPFKAEWPGRFQQLKHEKIVFIYDGAHNEDSLKVLGDTLHSEYPDRKIILGLAMQEGKNPAWIAKALHNLSYDLYTLDLPAGHHPQRGADLQKRFEDAGLTVAGHFATPQGLIDHAETRTGSVLVITGSLYAAQLIPERYWPTIEA